MPKVWDANYLRLERCDDLDAEAIAAEASAVAIAAGLRHARIVVAEEAVGARLARGLGELGYAKTRFVVMTLRRALDPPASRSSWSMARRWPTVVAS